MAIKKDFKQQLRLKRKIRVRKKIFGASEKPRLTVFRSATNIYAQLIDDEKQHTLLSASTIDKEKELIDGKTKKDKAFSVGMLIAKRALANGIKTIVFDRNGYLYHGRVKSLAEGAREGGLVF